ncbi:type II CRISPR-associated endonuclease Cas1 [bacterium]|nr:type II CRISPR-associated endonuclease Cas1 [bacterium]
MIKRTLHFSSPAHLSLKFGQLTVNRKDKEVVNIPVEDIGFIVFDHRQLSISPSLMAELLENNVAVIFSNDRHHPVGMTLTLDSNSVQSEKFRHQIAATEPMKKNLWQQTIKAKIRNQAAVLKELELPYKDLINLAAKVFSGDPDNKEGTAARLYWPRLFQGGFFRDRDGPKPNHMLNYAYTIVRAAVARALCGSGLLPTLGIHHKNKYNAYCLADDIMEPYRPFVDIAVYEIYQEYPDEDKLLPEIKERLLAILTMDTQFKKIKRPLMLGVSQTTASLAKCFAGEIKTLEYPSLS